MNKKTKLVAIILAAIGTITIFYGYYKAIQNVYFLMWPIESNERLLINLEAITKHKPATEKKLEAPKTSQVIDVESYIRKIKVTIKKLENSVAYKANNPGNLVYAGQPNARPVKFSGKIFASYTSPELGFRALIKQVQSDQNKGLTLEQFINKYAPAHENNTALYTSFVTENLQSDRTTNIKNLNAIELAKAMAKFESQTTVVEL